MQKLKNKSFKLSENEIHYLSILKNKYNIKVNQFVRLAIIEKMQRDVPKIRTEQRKVKLPF